MPRRVVTAPVGYEARERSVSVSSTSSRLSFSGGSRSPEDLVETLYNHPAVKIVSFTSSLRNSYGSPDFLDKPPPGSLSASSRLERTIAIGSFGSR